MKIVLTGETVPSGRPQFRSIHTKDGRSFVSAYTPAKTRGFQHDLRYRAQDAMNGQGLLKGPLSVTMRVYLPVPRSFSFKKQQLALSGALRPVTRPDLDNYIKQLDALNGVCWLDDSQIVILRALKLYSDHPSVEIEITEVEGTLPSQEQPQLFER